MHTLSEKLLSMLLALTMVISLLPVNVLAAEEVDLDDAVEVEEYILEEDPVIEESEEEDLSAPEVTETPAPEVTDEELTETELVSDGTAAKNTLASGGFTSGVKWEISDEYELILSGTGSTPDYTQSEVPWYGKRELITSIKVGEGVTTIGSSLFYGCKAVTSVSLPNTLKKIGDYGFAYCSGLTALTIPESVTTLGKSAFSGCSKMKSVNIPSGVTSIGNSTFYNCTKLESITIPESVTSIGSFAFDECILLENCTIPENVTSIGTYVFRGCVALTSVVIPKGVTSIGDGVFQRCTALTDVYYSGTAEEWSAITVGNYNTALTSATIHYACGENVYWTLSEDGTLTISGTGAMTNWTMPSTVPWYSLRSNIVSVVIENGVTSIGNNAYGYHTALKSVTIPDSVTRIGNYSFDGCEALTKISIPAGVTAIGDYVFYKCAKLSSVTMKGDVTSIGTGAFAYCYALETIAIPESVTGFGESAFHGCTALTEINIPAGVTTIADYAFSACTALTDVYYGADETAWNAISIGTENGALTKANIVFHTHSYTNGVCSCGAKEAKWQGDGTAQEPYKISSEAELRLLTEKVNAGESYSGNYFNITAPIAVTDTWTPIGTADTKFCGYLNGNDYAISGLAASGSYKGLFAYLGGGAVIRDVNLTDVNFAGTEYVGGIAAHADGSAGNITIIGCTVSGRVDAEEFAGGIVGYGVGSGGENGLRIESCVNKAVIPTGSNSTAGGGIGGYLKNAYVISCANFGAVSGNSSSEDNGSSNLGGIAGDSNGSTFLGCANYGNVSSFFPGGIAGGPYSTGTFINCLNVGTLRYSSDGRGYAIGSAINSNVHENCYYVGKGSYTTGDTSVTAEQLESGEVAYLMKDYFGQNIGVDAYPMLLNGANGVHKVTLSGAYSETRYATHGTALSDLGLKCVLFMDQFGVSIEASEPVTEDCVIKTAVQHNVTDGICKCGKTGTCGDGLTWELADGTLTISGTGALPEYSSEKPAPWAGMGGEITSVVIGEGVTKVPGTPFAGCDNLTDVTLQGESTRLEDSVLEGCDKLNTLSGSCGDAVTYVYADGKLTISGTGAMGKYDYAEHIPWYGIRNKITTAVIEEGVTSVAKNAFNYCTALTSVTLPDGITEIGSNAFDLCSKLTAVALPDSVTDIGYYAFHGSGLTEITLPAGLKTIGKHAFCDSAIGELTIPASVTSIGEAAFADMNNLPSISVESGNETYIAADGVLFTADGKTLLQYPAGKTDEAYEIPAGVTAVGAYAFSSTKLQRVTLPEGVTVIDDYAFYYNRNLTELVVPEGVTTIGDAAFQLSQKLQTVTLPASVTSIGRFAFGVCMELTDIYFGGSELQWNALGVTTEATVHCALIGSGTCGDDLTWELSNDGALTIRGEGKMDDYSDSDAPWAEVGDRIGSVVIEEGVTSIGGGAFQGCDNLTEITIPETVTEIGEDALTDCGNLKDIHFEGSAEQWEEIGGNLEGVEVQVAVAKGTCDSGLSWVLDVKSGVLTISGSGAMSDYTAENAPWAKYSDDITTVVIGSGVTAIGDNAFAGCNALESVAVPKSVKTIGDGAFYDCTALATVHYDHCSAGWDDIAIGADNECLTAATLISISEPTAAAAPALLATEIGDGTIAVSWEEIPGVYAYRVYRKAPGSSAWKKCGDTTDSVYVDSVTKNGNYTYTVCCLSSSAKTIGKYDSKGIKTVYYAAPKNAAVTNTADGVKISWKKVSGISKYGVYVETADGWQKIATTSSSSYTYKAAISGESYRLAVTCMNKAGTANYSVYSKAVSITYIAQPKINSMEVTENGLVIRWDDVPGADTYRVLRKSSGKWKTVAETTELSYLQESYKLGSSYTYSVVCIDGPEGAQISTYNKTGETIKPVKAPALKSISNTADGLKLSWGKVSGASKYRVLLLDGTQWVNVGETKSTSYTVKGLDSGKVHTLTVCCISSNGVARASGFDTDGMSLYYLAAPQITLTNTADGIKVDWESVNGADSYTVLRKSGSKWVVEAEGVTDTEYTYKKASSSKSYTFSLRSEAADGIKSAYNTTGKKLTYIAQPEIKSITNTTSGMKLTWGKVSGASKYRVYLVNEDGSLTKLKDTSSTSYTYTAAENGKNYTFTVVCLNSKSKEVSAYDPHGWMAGFVATPKLTALTNVQDGVKLTWEPVEGATGYQVMRKSGKTWVAEGEPVTDPEYIYTGATSGKSVTLSVKALMDGEESGYHSTGKKLTYIAQPVVTLSETAKGVKLSWKKVGGASKYRVYLVNEDGKLTKLKDTTSTSYTYTKIEEGKSYKFTVACLNSSGKIIGSYNADGWNYPLPE